MKNLTSKTSYGTIHALEIGESDHDAVLFMHGFPGSSQQGMVFREHAKELKLRVLAFDRPGYGLSSAVTYPSIKNFIFAIEEFLSEHKIEKFYLVGVSGGNPSALFAASYFGPRVKALGSICGLVPFSMFSSAFSPRQSYGLRLARTMPQFLLEPLIDFVLSRISPEDILKKFGKSLNSTDRDVLQDLNLRKVLMQSMTAARQQGSKGIIFDVKTFAGESETVLENIKCPYHLWHGKQDKVLSYMMSVRVNEKLPDSKLKLYENEGHYSLPIRRGREILTELVQGE